MLLGQGDGTLLPATTYNVENDANSVAVADWNGDGKPDLVNGNQGSGSVSVLLGNGDGTFQMPIYTAVTAVAGVSAGDFDGDGKPDLVNGNQGDGTFLPATTVTVGNVTRGVAIADLNGDGNLDVVAGGTPQAFVLLGNGDGTFQAPVGYPGNLWVSVADFDGDGHLDVIAGGPDADEVQVLLGVGDGTLIAPFGLGAAGQFPLSLADFDGDGKPDLLTAAAGSAVVGLNATN